MYLSSREKKEIRDVLIAEQGGLCAYCNAEMVGSDIKDKCDPLRATLDHIHPLSTGGSNHISNFVVACQGCNYAMGDKKEKQDE